MNDKQNKYMTTRICARVGPASAYELQAVQDAMIRDRGVAQSTIDAAQYLRRMKEKSDDE